jgi:hypothetical protein
MLRALLAATGVKMTTSATRMAHSTASPAATPWKLPNARAAAASLKWGPLNSCIRQQFAYFNLRTALLRT